MLKNDTLKNGTCRIGLYGSAPRLTTPFQAPPNKILIVHMVKDRVAYRAPYHQRGAKKIVIGCQVCRRTYIKLNSKV